MISSSRPCVPLEWSVAARPKPGELCSGDRHLVLPREADTLVALIDGLGHGTEAAAAAEVAIETLTQAVEGSPVELLAHCHEALRATRGAAISLAVIRPDRTALEWLGVGNVEGVILHRADGKRSYLVMRSGVVGDRMPPLRSTTIALAAGDLILFASDGIVPGFEERVRVHRSPQAIADEVILRESRPDDDAVLLVLRVPPGAGPSAVGAAP